MTGRFPCVYWVHALSIKSTRTQEGISQKTFYVLNLRWHASWPLASANDSKSFHVDRKLFSAHMHSLLLLSDGSTRISSSNKSAQCTVFYDFLTSGPDLSKCKEY